MLTSVNFPSQNMTLMINIMFAIKFKTKICSMIKRHSLSFVYKN